MSEDAEVPASAKLTWRGDRQRRLTPEKSLNEKSEVTKIKTRYSQPTLEGAQQ